MLRPTDVEAVKECLRTGELGNLGGLSEAAKEEAIKRMEEDGSLHRTYRQYIGNDTHEVKVIQRKLNAWFEEWKNKVFLFVN